jgi:hypothetical protein
MRAAAFILVTITLLSAVTTRAEDSVAINKLISEIDAAAKKDRSRMLSIITINTDVAGTTLEKEKARTGFTLGEVYVAHSIALAAKKSFSQIAAMKTQGNTWGKVAQMNKVSLRGATGSIKQLMGSTREE